MVDVLDNESGVINRGVRMSSGITGLDKMISGGFIPGRNILIM